MLTSEWQSAGEPCADHACVQVRKFGDVIQVRDSTNPDGDFLSFTRDEWIAFAKGAKAGEFDLGETV